ncbi:MAG: YceI family protein [Actinomycetota bacterium]
MNKKLVLGGGAAAVVVLIAAVWFLFFRNDAPEEVSVDAANAQLDEDLAAAAAEDDDAGDATDDEMAEESDDTPDEADTEDAVVSEEDFDGDVSGTWIIDDEIGDFDFETASGSFAGFRVDEELTVGEVVAVGRSGGVSGSLTIDAGQLTAAEVTVDMTTIVSNDSRRENAIRGAVGANENPTATFVLTGPVELPDGLRDGETVTVDAVGDLTVNGVTNPTTFTISALVRDDGFGIVTGSANIVFEDFDVTPPSAPIVVSIDDNGIVEFQLIVAKG